MGLGPGEGEGSFLATPSSLSLGAAIPQPLAGSLAPFLYLGHFPGQLGLKFSGEAPRARGIRGRPGSAQDPSRTSPRLPGLAAGRVTPRGGGGHLGAAKPRAVESRDLLGLRVLLWPEGGKGRGAEGRGAANPVLGSALRAWEVQRERDPRHRLYPRP